MTNEEARNTLKSLKDYYNDKNEDSYVGFDDEDNEALDLAIKALEQQPCKDCISRKDTIEWLKKVTVTEGIEFKTGFEQILYDIEQMPSVTPQTVTEFADKCKECGKIKEDLYEKGFEAGKRYIVEQMCALLEKEGKDGDSD